MTRGGNLLYLTPSYSSSDRAWGLAKRRNACLYERATETVLKEIHNRYHKVNFTLRNIFYAMKYNDDYATCGITLIDCSVRPVRTIAESDRCYNIRFFDDHALFVDEEDAQRLVVVDLNLKKSKRLMDGCCGIDFSKDGESVSGMRNNGPDFTLKLSNIDFSKPESDF